MSSYDRLQLPGCVPLRLYDTSLAQNDLIAVESERFLQALGVLSNVGLHLALFDFMQGFLCDHTHLSFRLFSSFFFPCLLLLSGGCGCGMTEILQ